MFHLSSGKVQMQKLGASCKCHAELHVNLSYLHTKSVPVRPKVDREFLPWISGIVNCLQQMKAKVHGNPEILRQSCRIHKTLSSGRGTASVYLLSFLRVNSFNIPKPYALYPYPPHRCQERLTKVVLETQVTLPSASQNSLLVLQSSSDTVKQQFGGWFVTQMAARGTTPPPPPFHSCTCVGSQVSWQAWVANQVAITTSVALTSASDF